MIRESRRNSSWRCFGSAGVSPAVFVSMFECRAAGGTPAPRNPVLDREALERRANRAVRGRTSGLGE
jgi:hypothetical protein